MPWLAIILKLADLLTQMLEWHQLRQLKQAGADEVSLEAAKKRARHVKESLDALASARADYDRLGRVPVSWRGWRD